MLSSHTPTLAMLDILQYKLTATTYVVRQKTVQTLTCEASKQTTALNLTPWKITPFKPAVDMALVSGSVRIE